MCPRRAAERGLYVELRVRARRERIQQSSCAWPGPGLPPNLWHTASSLRLSREHRLCGRHRPLGAGENDCSYAGRWGRSNALTLVHYSWAAIGGEQQKSGQCVPNHKQTPRLDAKGQGIRARRHSSASCLCLCTLRPGSVVNSLAHGIGRRPVGWSAAGLATSSPASGTPIDTPSRTLACGVNNLRQTERLEMLGSWSRRLWRGSPRRAAPR